LPRAHMGPNNPQRLSSETGGKRHDEEIADPESLGKWSINGISGSSSW